MCQVFFFNSVLPRNQSSPDNTPDKSPSFSIKLSIPSMKVAALLVLLVLSLAHSAPSPQFNSFRPSQTCIGGFCQQNNQNQNFNFGGGRGFGGFGGRFGGFGGFGK